MRKNKLLVFLLLPLFFLLPFGTYVNAQVPGYVGVAEGEQYTWKGEANFENVDDLLDNVRDLLADWKSNLHLFDFFGFKAGVMGSVSSAKCDCP